MATNDNHDPFGQEGDPTTPDDRPDRGGPDPRVTDHSTGEQQAAENIENEPAG